MINVFRPVQIRSDPSVSSYDGNSDTTPILPFNHTVESLNRNVYVKPLHSHNDYWRIHPLFDALSVGCQSVESDIWHFPDEYELERTVTETTDDGTQSSSVQKQYFRSNEIYVGHNQVYLEPINTLFNLYLNPLYQFLESSNPNFTFVDNSKNDHSPNLEHSDSRYSVFYNQPETPLYFWFDVKADPNSTYKALKPLLQPFIDKDYLAYYNATSDTFVPGPLILTLTGNLPTELVKQEEVRYFFLDGDLTKFNGSSDDATLKELAKLSVVASGSMEDLLGENDWATAKYGSFTSEQKSKLGAIFDLAHKYGVKTRIWGDITWPVNVLESHLQDLFTLKSDLLNVDDVKAAANFFK